MMSALESLRVSWDEAAGGYDAYFVPRFAPWVERAIEALALYALPVGCLISPCCGTGPELEGLRRRHPERALVGVDLSEGMLALARQRLGDDARVQLIAMDASQSAAWPRPIAGLVSCFGLQQLPHPEEGLEQWMRSVEPGGLLSVSFWPVVVEEEGPFAWLSAALVARGFYREQTWEGGLAAAVERGGGELLVDERVSFEMRHDSAEVFWTQLINSGPLRALARAAGDEVMEALHQDFLARAPSGELVHWPQARQIVARRM